MSDDTYQPRGSHPPPPAYGDGHGSGIPNNDLGVNGDTYVDDDTGILYVRTNGEWIVAGGGAGSSGDGSPEGVRVGNPGATYWDATNNILYVKDTGTGTNTGWVVFGGI